MRYKAVLFDLDGTLLDTLSDLAGALNAARQMNGLPAQDIEQIRSYIGNGRRKLIERSLSTDPGEYDEELAVKLLTDDSRYYNSHCMINTKPYDGIVDLIRRLKSDGIRICCVTNKADETANTLIGHFFPDMFDIVAGSVPEVPVKPDPAVVERCLIKLGLQESECVFIGDSEVDIQTAANAGMDCISVCWGYKTREFLEREGAMRICTRPLDLRRYIYD